VIDKNKHFDSDFLRHILSFATSSHESITRPSDDCIGHSKPNTTKGKGGIYGFTVGLPSIDEDGSTCCRYSQE